MLGVSWGCTDGQGLGRFTGGGEGIFTGERVSSTGKVCYVVHIYVYKCMFYISPGCMGMLPLFLRPMHMSLVECCQKVSSIRAKSPLSTQSTTLHQGTKTVGMGDATWQCQIARDCYPNSSPNMYWINANSNISWGNSP